jgi:hypothetical protein
MSGRGYAETSSHAHKGEWCGCLSVCVPLQAFTQVGPTLQQIPAQLQQLTRVFQVQSASAPAPGLVVQAPMAGALPVQTIG